MASALPPDQTALALAQLRDIHLPASIGWWPPAPGWYLLAGFLLAALVSIGFLFWRRHVNGRAKRHALRLLGEYYHAYQSHPQNTTSCIHLSELLRRVALAYYPSARVASLHGDAWVSFLTETARGVDFNQVRFELLELPYKPQEAYDLTLFFNKARQWIKQRGAPCLN